MTLSSNALAKSTPSQVKEILQRPLIVGASVSADFLTPSPGKRLALKYTSSENIKVIARNGKPAREVLKSVSEVALKDRTATLQSLLPDGLHIGPPASEYLSERILEIL